MSIRRAGLAALFLALGAGPARAAPDLLSPETFSGLVELRLAAADGERSWLDGGFGKTGASGGGSDWAARPDLSQALIQWKPRLSFSLAAVVSAQVQPDVDPAFDLGEAYLTWRAAPNRLARFSARAGLFYPPVSQEHEGVGWTTPDVLSASAIGSWIGEEVKVAGLELTATRALGDHEVSATAAAFGANDTSGTLLSFRGWALHGVRTGASTDFPLPALSPFMRTRQAPISTPVGELDNRAGYYGRLAWRPPVPIEVSAFYYDNAGDRTSVEALQWAWETRFTTLGLVWSLDEVTTLRAQVLRGETLMGFRYQARHRWIDMGYASAHVSAVRRFGDHALTLRVDGFETNDRTLQAIDNNDETGWALTAAWRHRLSPRADLLFEGLHVSSDRPSRIYGGVAPDQDQTVLQSALRLSF
ncbi:hypothetical protein [Phenylobacterium sp.]|uniref:hypothetical protein n=1 Tax=Phenylobacterium sp. TaxID=1871053 RepID=UPI0027342D11|nr:hypothetical protein [Phenylobacterium sp.]MDP3854936.1 hypothetical protein [Phenylobacterium sp.]